MGLSRSFHRIYPTTFFLRDARPFSLPHPNRQTMSESVTNGRANANGVDSVEQGKRLAAFAAVDDNVRAKMVVGVGSGSTIAYAVERLAEKVREGMAGVVCVPTSFQSKQLI